MGMHGNCYTDWDANSFCSEGIISQLLLLVFLQAYLAYYQMHDLPHSTLPPNSPPRFLIATDNKGLIERITTEQATKTAFVGAALCSEYDVVHKIVEIT
jgi:hypothetical protein